MVGANRSRSGVSNYSRMTRNASENVASRRSRGGLGLGLALVKGLVDLHGGTVDVHSEGLGKSSESTIRLPLEHEMIVSESTACATPKRPARRVLIIEDNVDAADTLRAALEFGNHKVEVAVTARRESTERMCSSPRSCYVTLGCLI
jgi:hypothetical protein